MVGAETIDVQPLNISLYELIAIVVAPKSGAASKELQPENIYLYARSSTDPASSRGAVRSVVQPWNILSQQKPVAVVAGKTIGAEIRAVQSINIEL